MSRSISKNREDRLIWIDCEMTGLDSRKDQVIEISCVITEADLTIVGEKMNFVINQPENVLSNMNNWCKKTFAENGLLEKIKSSSITAREAEDKILEHLLKYTDKGKCPLAGNSVGLDREFINGRMKRLSEHLHYRNVDVSSFKEMMRRWYPTEYSTMPPKRRNHRSLDDILESIDELRWYRSNMLR